MDKLIVLEDAADQGRRMRNLIASELAGANPRLDPTFSCQEISYAQGSVKMGRKTLDATPKMHALY